MSVIILYYFGEGMLDASPPTFRETQLTINISKIISYFHKTDKFILQNWIRMKFQVL